MRVLRLSLLLLAVGIATGCGPSGGRHVVVPPEQMGGLNSADWSIKSEPAKAETPAADPEMRR
jgi:hypothetical protein